jgi:putative restriction endonuclease
MTEQRHHLPSPALELDYRVRLAAFEFLREQQAVKGEVLPRRVLAGGFEFDGQRVPLIGPQGIFKPAILPEVPLTITTVPVIEGRARPYEDEIGPDGLLRYRYRGTDPRHRDNVGLRLAMTRQTPLIYLYGVIPGEYLPRWPVFVVRDEPDELSFSIAVEQEGVTSESVAEYDLSGSAALDATRRYATRLFTQRMHQVAFRQRVLRAYRERCAVCRLTHKELLDAAHILPDGHPKGEPIVSNGLALCKLHHAAFDSYILGVRPDLTVEIRLDVLHEGDGPMLRHGLQGFQGSRIIVPSSVAHRPKSDFLAERYDLFKKAV